MLLISLQYFSNDATFSEGLGRLVNDERATKSNRHIKKIAHNNKVNLCLFAKKDIPANTELQYDYGVSDLPWRKTGKPPDNTITIILLMFMGHV